MEANVGGIDRAVRFIAGLILLILGIFCIKSVVWTVIFIVLGAIIFLTALFRRCCLYVLLGINTKKPERQHTPTQQPSG